MIQRDFRKPSSQKPRARSRMHAVSLMVFLGLSSAYAWKPNTHVYLAEEVIKDAIPDGQVTICRTNFVTHEITQNCSNYQVDPEILQAIRSYPQQFRAGVLGPDAYPDILTGQQVIHPDESLPHKPEPPGGTNSWLQYLWDRSNAEQGGSRLPVRAFTVGFLTHSAGDLFGHTFVNNYTGGPFSIGPNAVRHVVLEGYIGKRTPNITDIYGQPVTENSFSIDQGVREFIYQNMVNATPGSVLLNQLMGGGGTTASVPYIYSGLRAGLQRDIDNYYAALREFDRRSAEKVRAAENCGTWDFSCSATLLYGEAAAIQLEKAAFRVANGPIVTYKEYWVDDIDLGLRAWPELSQQLAKVLVFNPNGVDTARAQQLAQTYVQEHLLSMSGVPDIVGITWEVIEKILDALVPQFLIDAINDLKRDLLNTMLQAAIGMTVDDLKRYVTNPELYFDQVMATGPNPITLDAFNRQELHIDENGMPNPSNPTRFDYRQVAAAYNTVTLTKMLMLGSGEMNRLLQDLGSSQRLQAPNIMLGFVRSLDDSNQWVANNPYQLILANDCGAFRQVFMQQSGEVDSCVNN